MRDRTKLHPKLQKKLSELESACKKAGLKIQITECVRTVAEQDALYAKGRTKPGVKVTNAPGYSYSSHHMWGTAFDFIRADGKEPYYDKDGFFTKVGKIGKSLGLEWGGDWKSPVDKPHFQLPDWGSTTKQLKAIYGTPDKFMKTWSTKSDGPKTDKAEDVKMKTIKAGAKGDVVKIWQIIVGLPPGGVFDTKTERATKEFQRKHNLTVDGIVGDKSWSAGLKSL